jgi:quercetin dioxygenase-like cupin family protein
MSEGNGAGRTGKGFVDTSWDEAEFLDTPIGKAFLIDIGDEENPRRPLVALVHFPPGTEIPVHSHGTDYVSIVVEGSMEVTRKQHGAGDVRIVNRDTAYGPLVAGPDGCKVIEIFADRSGLLATYPKDDELSRRFVAMQEEFVRARLADVQSTTTQA